MEKKYVPLVYSPHIFILSARVFDSDGRKQKEKEVADGLIIYIPIFLLYGKYVPFVLKICNDLK